MIISFLVDKYNKLKNTPSFHDETKFQDSKLENIGGDVVLHLQGICSKGKWVPIVEWSVNLEDFQNFTMRPSPQS